MDVMKQAMEIAQKVQSDPEAIKKFQENPTAFMKELLGVELDPAIVQSLLATVSNMNKDEIVENGAELLKKFL